MKNFEFNVSAYFKLEGGFFGLVGTMKPDGFPIITPNDYVNLITKSGREHVFKDIGEEIVVRSSSNKSDKRAFRTRDDIEEYLKNLPNDPIRIVGSKLKK